MHAALCLKDQLRRAQSQTDSYCPQLGAPASSCGFGTGASANLSAGCCPDVPVTGSSERPCGPAHSLSRNNRVLPLRNMKEDSGRA